MNIAANDHSTLEFVDTTLRDGPQSNWGMRMTHGMQEAVVDEMNRAGFDAIELPMGFVYAKLAYRLFCEDPWPTFHMWRDRLDRVPHQFTTGVPSTLKGMLANSPPKSMCIFHFDVLHKNCGYHNVCLMANTVDEMKDWPWLIPALRAHGGKIIIDLVYAVSPRHTDQYYAELTRKCVEWKPDGFKIKDVDGLLTPERARTLLAAVQKEAKGITIEMHCHCSSTHAPEVFMEAMKLGVRKFHTAIPPLAYGTGHPSIFNTIENASYLGLTHNINLEPLQSASEKLTKIAKQEGLMIGAPIEFDYGHYVHMVPGGVTGTMKYQLELAGLSDKYEDVLTEVSRILKDMAYPIMVTPISQFIVAQATINVATGERYKEILDPMIDLALGVYGTEDTGVAYMDQNIKDKLLNAPSAKQRKQAWEKEQKEMEEDPSLQTVKKRMGKADASDEEFFDYYFLDGGADAEAYRAAGSPKPKNYYTGDEPLVYLLKELNKETKLKGLTMQKGNDFFEFRR